MLRPATKADFKAIRSLIHRVQINPTGLDWRRFIVAVDTQDELIGCGQIKPHADGSREMASIAVQSEFRGRGVARAVITELLRREPRRPLFLMCRARLQPLYAKFGFYAAPYAQLPRYFRRIKRLENMFNQNAAAADRLLVMRLDGGSPE